MPSAATRPPALLTRRLRQFFRFNLRSALLLTAIVCALLAWVSRDLHLVYRRSRLMAEVERLGGHIDRIPHKPSWHSPLNLIDACWDSRLVERFDGVTLAGPQVTDDDVARLAPLVHSLPEISWISLAKSSITDRSSQPLATCTQLRHLDLSETLIAAGGLEPLSQLTNLEGLSLWGTAVTDDAVLQLGSLSELTILDLSRTKVTDRSLNAAREWPKLREIRLQGTGVTDAGILALAARGWPNLQEIRLSGTGVTDVGVLALQRRLPKLKVWVIAGNHLRSHDEMAKSTTLSLRDPFFGDAYLDCLADFPQVQALYLDGSRVTAAGLRKVPHDKIQLLWLDYTAVDDQALEAIAQWLNLRELMLRNSGVTDAGLAQLAAPRLNTLWLTGTSITDEGLTHVGRLRELEFLNLSATKIDGSGLGHLAGLTKLRRLLLDATAVTDDSLRNLPPLPALECLDLERTKISDAGVEHLKTFPKLRSVPSGESKITAPALEFFAARQPPGQDDSSVRPPAPTANAPPMQ